MNCIESSLLSIQVRSGIPHIKLILILIKKIRTKIFLKVLSVRPQIPFYNVNPIDLECILFFKFLISLAIDKSKTESAQFLIKQILTLRNLVRLCPTDTEIWLYSEIWLYMEIVKNINSSTTR